MMINFSNIRIIYKIVVLIVGYCKIINIKSKEEIVKNIFKTGSFGMEFAGGIQGIHTNNYCLVQKSSYLLC